MSNVSINMSDVNAIDTSDTDSWLDGVTKENFYSIRSRRHGGGKTYFGNRGSANHHFGATRYYYSDLEPAPVVVYKPSTSDSVSYQVVLLIVILFLIILVASVRMRW